MRNFFKSRKSSINRDDKQSLIEFYPEHEEVLHNANPIFKTTKDDLIVTLLNENNYTNSSRFNIYHYGKSSSNESHQRSNLGDVSNYNNDDKNASSSIEDSSSNNIINNSSNNADNSNHIIINKMNHQCKWNNNHININNNLNTTENRSISTINTKYNNIYANRHTNSNNINKRIDNITYKKIGYYAVPKYQKEVRKNIIYFLPCDKFEGYKEDYQYCRGKHGQGYYFDSSKIKPVLEPNAYLPNWKK